MEVQVQTKPWRYAREQLEICEKPKVICENWMTKPVFCGLMALQSFVVANISLRRTFYEQPVRTAYTAK